MIPGVSAATFPECSKKPTPDEKRAIRRNGNSTEDSHIGDPGEKGPCSLAAWPWAKKAVKLEKITIKKKRFDFI